MLRSSAARWITGAVAFVALITVLRFKPWQGKPANAIEARETLAVGYLPVTCHLTCPVTDFATRTSTSSRFVSQLYTDFPTVVESFKAGRLKASFIIAPLAM